MKINAKPGQAIIPVKAESCDECVFYNGVSCVVHYSDRDCTDYGRFGGYVFKVVSVNQLAAIDLMDPPLGALVPFGTDDGLHEDEETR
jgi:hypothetical protein